MDEWEFADPVDVLSKLPENFKENVESKKWQERKEALEAFFNILEQSIKLDPKGNYNEMVSMLKTMLLKDANINVAALAAKCLTLMAKGLRQKFGPYANEIVIVICEKFKEKRKVLADELIACIDAMYETSNLDALAETIQGALGKPNPQIKGQTSQFLYRVFMKFTTSNVPNKHVKAFAPLLVKLLSESDPDVRDSSSAALGAMMKSIHEKNMATLVGDVSQDKNKWSKIQEYKEKAEKDYEDWLAAQPKPAAPPQTSSTSAATSAPPSTATITPAKAAPAEVDPWDFLEPVDITKDISKTFFHDIQSKKWQERKEALESLLGLLEKNGRLDPKGQYSDTIAALSTLVKNDANINVGSAAVKCVKHFATGLRKAFHPFVNSITPIVLEKFKEKKPILRDPLAECIDAIYSTTNLDHIAEHVTAALGNKNPNVKIQTSLFLYRVFKNFGPATAPKKQVKEMTPLIVKLTSESDPEVRDAACAALGAIMKSIGKKAALPLISDVATDKLKMAKIEEFHDKAVAEAGPEIVAEMIQSIHKQDEKPKENGGLAKNGKPVVKPGAKPPTKTQPQPAEEPAENGVDEEEPLKPVGKPDGDVTARQKAADRRRSKSRSSMVPNEAKAPEPPAAPSSLLIAESDRNGRAKDEKNLKLLKWNFDAPTGEHVQQLTTQFNDVCKVPLSQQLFSKDFKMHLKAIDYMQQLITFDPVCVLNNVDLILKWMTLRFFDTNPAVLLRGLELTTAIFEYMDANNEKLLDTEMTSFLPYLLIKSGEPKDAVRIHVKKIVRLLGGICPAAKIFPLVLDALKTKNSRQKAECLQIADHFLECLGTNVAPNPPSYMKAIASCIADRDSNVRNSALNAITTVYKKIGDKVYGLIGKLDDKEKAMLDERIRRTGRDTTQTFEPDMGDNDTTTVKMRGDTPRVKRPPSKERAMEQNVTERLNALLDNNHRRPLPDLGDNSSDKHFSLGSKFMDLPLNGNENNPFSLRSTETMNLEPLTPAVLPTSSSRSSHPRRADSMASITSLETQEQLDRVIYGISSVTVETVLESLAQLHFLLTDENQQLFLVDRADLIIKTVVTQLSVIRGQHLTDPNSAKETNELLRTLSNFLHTFATTSVLAEKLTQHTIKSLMSEFLQILCDTRLAQLPNSHEIIKSLNLIVAKFCEHANPNQCFSALIKLLMTLLDQDHTNKSISLLMKCIFKQLEFLQQRLEKLEIDKFLITYHEFFKKFPIEQYPHLKEILTPMQICLQRLVLLTRPQITEYLHMLPADSFVVTYIKRCLRAIERKEAEKGIAPVQKTGPGSKLEKMLQSLGTNLVHGSIEQLYNYLENNPSDRSYVEKFAQANRLDLDLLFDGIRLKLAKGEPIRPVDSVKPLLKSDDMEYFERQHHLGHRFEEILEQMEAKPGSAMSHSHSNTSIGSTNGIGDVPSAVMTASDLQPAELNTSMIQPRQTPVTTQPKRPKRLSQMEIAAFKERLENIRKRDED